MEDAKRNDLLFKPDISPYRHYESQAIFEKENIELPSESYEDTPDERQQIIDDLEELREMLQFLPDGLQFIGGTIDKLIQREKVIQYEESLPTPDEPEEEKPITPVDCVTNCSYDDGCSPTDCNCAVFNDCTINDCDCIPEGNCDCLDCVTNCNENTNCISFEDCSNETNCGAPPSNCHTDCDEWSPPDQNPPGEYEWTDCSPNPLYYGEKQDDNPKVITYIDSIVSEDTPQDLRIPNLFPSPTNISIDLVQPRSLVQIAKDAYKNDTIELHRYYIQRLQTALQHYFQQMMTIMQEAGVSKINDLTQDFDGDRVQVSSADLAHLRDHIVRSQIAREQKEALMSKVHSVDNTLVHMRSWHAAEKERERYYNEKYGDSGTFLDSSSNELLRKGRSSYDKHYSQALYNMYKYLNSSVINIGETLDMVVDEAKGKGKLLKEGVDIYQSRKQEVKKAREEQLAAAQAEHDEKVKKAKSEKQKDQNGKEVSKGTNTAEQDYTKFAREGLPGSSSEESSDKAEDKGSDANASRTKDISEDKQYQNDMEYLKKNGYTEEAAKAELSKLPQYKDRITAQKDAKKESANKNELNQTDNATEQFAKVKAEHPEWFDGNTYIGDVQQAAKDVAADAKAKVEEVKNKVEKKLDFWSVLGGNLPSTIFMKT